MAQSFLEAGEHRLLVAGLDVDHPGRRQAGLGKRGREQILAGDAPEHLAFGARGDAGGEQRRRRAVDRAVAAARHLVQRAEGKPAAGQHRVDLFHAEGKRRAVTGPAVFEAARCGGGVRPARDWRERQTYGREL